MRIHTVALLLIFNCMAMTISAQESQSDFDGRNWTAPYFLDTPKDWGRERFTIPMQFAPAIKYKGVEDVRFTPGWADNKSSEYWSYAFLWYLDGEDKFNARIIRKNLSAYYTGLFKINTEKNKLNKENGVEARVSIYKRKKEGSDIATFHGTVDMFDYMTTKPIRLNVRVHFRYCATSDKTLVFHEISPKPYSDEVWSGLHKLWSDFRCIK